mmetsp:Transcript_43574/g.109284  ORF Transcript_43574/g.109284 Transcript_43574/m.109284 type:complete len:477 (+) Transcript_43574:1255-2685(+)
MLGVMMVASGKRSEIMTAPTPSSASESPLVEMSTGSTTSAGAPCRFSAAATARITSALGSMPVFTAPAPMSPSTLSICCVTNAGSTANTPCTPCVFWAVSAVMADMPKTPLARNALRSAWMPAPPPESEPAMVRARGTFGLQAGAAAWPLAGGDGKHWDSNAWMSLQLSARKRTPRCLGEPLTRALLPRAASSSGRTRTPAAAAICCSAELVPTMMPTSASSRAPRSVAESPRYTDRRPSSDSAAASLASSCWKAAVLSSAHWISRLVAPLQRPSSRRSSVLAWMPSCASLRPRAARMRLPLQLTESTWRSTPAAAAARSAPTAPGCSSTCPAAPATAAGSSPSSSPAAKASSFMRRSKSESRESMLHSAALSKEGLCSAPLSDAMLSISSAFSAIMRLSTALSFTERSWRMSCPASGDGAAFSAPWMAASMMMGVVSAEVQVSSKSVTSKPMQHFAGGRYGCALKKSASSCIARW